MVRGVEVPLPAVVGALLTAALWVAAVATSEGARIAGPVWLACGVGVYLWSRRAAGETVLGRATPPEPDLVPTPEGEHRRILVPVKPGEIGREVLATAMRLAKESGGSVRAIHVLKIPMSQELEVDIGDADSEALAVVQEARDAGRDEGVIGRRPRAAGAVAQRGDRPRGRGDRRRPDHDGVVAALAGPVALLQPPGRSGLAHRPVRGDGRHLSGGRPGGDGRRIMET